MRGFALPSVLVAASLLGAAGCAGPATDRPAAPAAGPPSGTSRVVYDIGSPSKIGFVGSKVTGSHDGGFDEFAGEIVVVDGDPAKSSMRVVIDTASLWADDPELAAQLKSADFFDVAGHPTAEFTSTSISALCDAYTVTGNLRLHGVERSISFPASIALVADGVTATAQFSIRRFDFGIAGTGAADDSIRDDVLIRLELVAAPRS